MNSPRIEYAIRTTIDGITDTIPLPPYTTRATADQYLGVAGGDAIIVRRTVTEWEPA